MAIEDDEQKEILLGNKQLLSIFFIVVVLLGVSFTIGYIIGKNTATMHAAEPARTAAVQTDAQPPSSSPAAEPAPRREEPTPSPVASPTPSAHAAAPSVTPTTHPAKPYDADTAPQPTTDAAPLPAVETAVAGGSYLQVGALKREDADNIAKVLRNRGYPTVLGESSKEGLFRVLVGPFKNMTDLAESKQKLKASGMDSFIVK